MGKVDYYFHIYPGASWLEFFHLATTGWRPDMASMTLAEAKAFAKDIDKPSEAITKLKGE